jgi:hypothetical protein
VGVAIVLHALELHLSQSWRLAVPAYCLRRGEEIPLHSTKRFSCVRSTKRYTNRQLVYLLVEVQSEKDQSHRYRMLLKGACVARLGRQFYVKPHIVVALYIENHAGHAVKDPRESVKNLDCRVEEVCQSPVALAIFVFCRSSSS